MTNPAPPGAVPIAEIERRLKWRLLPTLLFGVILVLLLGMAIVSLTMQPRHPHGLPDDPDARAAVALLAGRVSAPTDDMRWRAAVLGGEPPTHAGTAGMLARVAIARPALEAAHRRHRGDPRSLAALAALDIAVHDYARAAGRYRRACELAPHYGEGRLGAGVALALSAQHTPELWTSRALRMQAVAQFAMVDSVDDEYLLALYDRALVLAELGRAHESAFYADRFLAREPSGPHADALRAALAGR
jgi:tetratricopeptide (TPR) repeat protein